MIFNERELARLVHEAPERAGKTHKQVAQQMGGIDPKHLSRQINPMDPGAKMGLEDFVFFTATTDFEGLDYIEGALGRVAFKLPNFGDTEDVVMAANAGLASQRFGAWLQKVGDAMGADSERGAEISQSEARELIEEGDAVMRVFAKCRAYLAEKLKQ